MTLLNIILPHLQKFKYFVILIMVFVITMICCRRWPSFLPKWYIGCAITVSIALVIILGYLFFKKRHEKRMAAALEAGISAADEDKVDLKGEIKALRENWQSSLAKLKQSRMGADTKTILFKLPWYVIIGEPASGKSTLLRKSGLDFPVGDAEVAGLHGTRNCDWWFANEAIFLDTAGRYIIESQEQEWSAFMDLLKKYRSKKPINGVMVALPANSLLTKNHDELLVDGKRIRQRIDELIDGLGINFPIYVLVTKVDLVSGFVEFFGNLERRHAEQMVGWTNPQDTTARFDGEVLDQRFKEVSTRLFQMRPWLESKAKKRDLMKAFLYPEEFSYLNQPLRTVLDVVFKPNVYQETPVCRGVYFSSGTQVGGPLALALEDMARDLGISADFGFGLTMEEEKELRTYFIKDLVSEQILKDQEMNWRTFTAEAKLRKRRMGWGLIGLAVALLLALFATKSFIQNQSRLTDFKVSIPEGARPLEAATGCLKTRDDAVRPGWMDIGLNYSDELIPSMNTSFRSVFSRGCLSPLLADLAKPIKAGIKEDENGTPDVNGYLATWQQYVYLRNGPPDEPDDAQEEPKLEALFTMLRARDGTGRGTRDDFRYALKEYGGLGSDDGFKVQREEVESAFIASLTPIVRNSERWVAGVRKSDRGFEKAFNKAIEKLKKDCARYKSKVAPHEAEEDVENYAKEIKKSAAVKIGGGGDGPSLEKFAGVTETADLTKLLLLVKAAYPNKEDIAEQDVPKKGHLPERIDVVVADLGKPVAQVNLRGKESARNTLVAFLDKVIAGDDQTYAYESPTRESLIDRQTEIKEELDTAQTDAWDEVKAAVVELEGAPIEQEDEEGNTVRESGWWDVFPLLARARLTDLRKGEYLDDGLTVFLKDDRWWRERKRDRKEDMFTFTRLEDLILPSVREQVSFFQDEYTATGLADDALVEGTAGVAEFLKALSAYWTQEFEKGVPQDYGATLPEIYAQLDEWPDMQSNLRTICQDIEDALVGIMDLKGPEDDPIAESTFEDRRKIYETFVVCFVPRDREMKSHATVDESAQVVASVARLLKPVVQRSLGGVNAEAARVLVGKILTGTDASLGALADAKKVLRKLRNETGSAPSQKLADWLETLINNAWERLVEQAAEDINSHFAALADDWRISLSSGDPLAFKRIFGNRNSEILNFQRDYIQPFFRGPNRMPIEVDGSMLILGDNIRRFLGSVRTFGGSLFTDSGGIRSDNMELALKISGNGPEGLKIHYQSESGTKTSDERRTDEVPVSFEFNWSPTTCESFSMEVFFRGNSSKKLPRIFTGKWAVAEALAAANAVSGNTFIWRGEEPGLGDWEIQLTFTSGGAGDLFKVYQEAKGQDPLEWIVSKIPRSIVEVRKRGR